MESSLSSLDLLVEWVSKVFGFDDVIDYYIIC